MGLEDRDDESYVQQRLSAAAHNRVIAIDNNSCPHNGLARLEIVFIEHDLADGIWWARKPSLRLSNLEIQNFVRDCAIRIVCRFFHAIDPNGNNSSRSYICAEITFLAAVKQSSDFEVIKRHALLKPMTGSPARYRSTARTPVSSPPAVARSEAGRCFPQDPCDRKSRRRRRRWWPDRTPPRSGLSASSR
jgi:hypothetical protein